MTGLLAAAAVTGLATTAAPASERAQDPPRAVRPARPLGLSFRNHFWVNFHHFLYAQAVAAERRGAVEEAPDAWMAAVEYYRSTLISRDLLFDSGMREIDVKLGRVATRAELDALGLPDGLAQVLSEAAPLYLDRFWRDHERGNAEWAAAVVPLLQEHGPHTAERLSDVLVSQWPSAVLVDVLVYANWAGAYTSSGPDHIRIASAIPRRESAAESFETVFHEASHLMVDTLADRIDRAAARAGTEPPRDLWHAILFTTCGELARRSPATPDDYVPYAERHGLYERSPQWKMLHPALQEHWLPYIGGETTMDEALDAIFADVAEKRRE